MLSRSASRAQRLNAARAHGRAAKRLAPDQKGLSAGVPAIARRHRYRGRVPIIGVDHVQVAAPAGCEDEARRFFGGLLGLPELTKPAALAVRGGVWFEAGAQQLHVGVTAEFTPASKAHAALRAVPGGLDELAGRLAAAGHPVLWDGQIPGGRRIYTEDPWGNRLEIVEPVDEPVRLVPYDPSWPTRFGRERAELERALAPWISGGVHHVGSTAVPGMSAKPTIDMMVGVRTLEESLECFGPLAVLGYLYAPYRPEQMHWFCKPDISRRRFHLHLVPESSHRFGATLAFRDRLRGDPAVAERYAALKRGLAERFPRDRDAYTGGKADFIVSISDSSLDGSE
jgi:GrpB-like predicted nucleotidyltransferase (UPF0157 family)